MISRFGRNGERVRIVLFKGRWWVWRKGWLGSRRILFIYWVVGFEFWGGRVGCKGSKFVVML